MAGDEADFAGLALPHLDAAYNLARWLLRDPVAAEDVVQDALLRALTYFASFRGNRGKTPGDACFPACADAAGYDSLGPCRRPPTFLICRAPSWKPKSRCCEAQWPS